MPLPPIEYVPEPATLTDTTPPAPGVVFVDHLTQAKQLLASSVVQGTGARFDLEMVAAAQVHALIALAERLGDDPPTTGGPLNQEQLQQIHTYLERHADRTRRIMGRPAV